MNKNIFKEHFQNKQGINISHAKEMENEGIGERVLWLVYLQMELFNILNNY